MSDAASNPAQKNAVQKPLPAWIASGIMGLALGGGGTFLAMHYIYGFAPPPTYTGMPPAGMGGGPGGPPGGGMMGGGMMGGGMMGGGMGGGGGARGKRNLTSLVGKLDLLSKGISFQLDDEQSAKLAAQLADLDQPENMTQDEAQERLDALEAILTEEQKETLAQIDIPRGGRGGAGPGGSGPGGGGPGGPPAAMAGMMPGGMMGGGMMGGGGAPDDSNPFQQEANQTRLHSLLDRLKGSSAPDAATTEKAENGT